MIGSKFGAIGGLDPKMSGGASQMPRLGGILKGQTPPNIGLPQPMDKSMPGGAVLSNTPGPLAAPVDIMPENFGDAPKPRGFFDRIGDFINSGEGRAALLRSGAATIDNGIGAGITAGANYIDQRHGREAAAKQQQFENDLGVRKVDIQQQDVDQTGEYRRDQTELGYTNAANDTAKIAVEQYRARVDEAMKRAGLTLEQQRIVLDDLKSQRSDATQRRGQDLSYDSSTRGQDTQYGIAQMNQEGQNYRHVTPGAGIGTKTVTTTKAPPQSGGMFGTATPATETVTTSQGGGQPNYGEIITDGRGGYFRLDPITGRAIRVPRPMR